MAAAHALGPRPVPSAARAGLAPLFDELVARLTAVEPSERPADGGALVALLEDVTHGRAVAPRPAARAPRRADDTCGDVLASPRQVPDGLRSAPRRAAPARWLLPVALAVGLIALAATALLLYSGDNDTAAPVVRQVCARELTLRDQPVKGSATLATAPRGGTVAVVGRRALGRRSGGTTAGTPGC